MIRLPKNAYEWALKHLTIEGDTDLFPIPFEIRAMKYNWQTAVIEELAKLDLTSHEWNAGRRFVVPKEEFTFRSATQLDPLDSLILAAILRKHGQSIEDARIPVSHGRVFSYRFDPQTDGRFYGPSSNWHGFWQASLERVEYEGYDWVAVADVADYYNQIYHHTLENQLVESGVPKTVMRAIKSLLGKLTHGVSRGIPIGPHSVHLLAECAMIPVDRSLLSHGYDFCRYVDDVHLFCRSREQARVALQDTAEILDKQHRLTLQGRKTRILPAGEFVELANSMLVDRPLNEDEEKILEVVNKYGTDDPYETISIKKLSEDDRKILADDKLIGLFELYLEPELRNYPRIGWLLRRLSQVGAPGAVDYVLRKISDLAPVLGDVARYVIRAGTNYEGDAHQAGELVLNALDLEVVERNEYLSVVLLNLFTEIPSLGHINSLTAKYATAPPPVRRELITAAGAARQGHWIKERKDEFASADPWLRRALIYASHSLPGDEAEHWIKKTKGSMSGMEKLVARWAFENKSMKVGGISVT